MWTRDVDVFARALFTILGTLFLLVGILGIVLPLLLAVSREGDRAHGFERYGGAFRSLRPRAAAHVEVKRQKVLMYASIR
jgi:hypothetical protein